MGSDGSNPRRLTNNIDWNLRPVWSPDSRHIAFTSYREGNGDIYVIGSDGSNPGNLTTNHQESATFPRWSPDGRHITFQSSDGWSSEIYLITFQRGGGQ